MCLLVVGWQAHPHHRLIIAANRDEYHERAAAPLGKWTVTLPDASRQPTEIIGGRDVRAGGTWLAVDRLRRVGVVTNYRDLQPPRTNAPSRGQLILDYLTQPHGPREFLEQLEADARRYAGFNLLLSDAHSFWYASNRARPFARALGAGIYGLSNHLLDTPWPKLTRVRNQFQAWLARTPSPPADELLDMLGDRAPATAQEQLPTTGLTPEWERVLSAPFVLHPRYGTRSSTLLVLESTGALSVHERRFDAAGLLTGETRLALNATQW